MTTLHRTWETWTAYFDHNAQRLLEIDWEKDDPLTQDEWDRIIHSIQQFQLGESSEGNHVLAHAQQYAERTGDEGYPHALRLFIKEEQRHSQYLKRFMQKHDMPLTASDPTDSMFRFLRRAFNLELSVMAMMTAEIIAIPYYRSLSDATNSPLLKQICRQILRDEMQHLQFQLDTLSKFDEKRSQLGVGIVLMVHRLLFMGTLFIVWQHHYTVLRSGHESFQNFWRASWQQFNHLRARHHAVPQEIVS